MSNLFSARRPSLPFFKKIKVKTYVSKVIFTGQ